MAASKERILIADDDPDVLDLLGRQALPSLGYQVSTAVDGTAAIDQARRWGPHLVLADLELPGMHGTDLLLALRAQGLDAPVVMMAERGREAEVLQALRVGAKDYLVKPIHEAEAVSAVERGLADARLRLEREQLALRLGEVNALLERRVRELTTLSGIGRAVTSVTQLDELLKRVVEGALFVAEADMAWLMLEADSGGLVLRAHKGLPPVGARPLGQSWDDGVASRVMASREPLRLVGASLAQFNVAHVAQSVLVAPIKAKNRAVGTIAVANRAPKPFTDRTEAMLAAVADYASVALVNARLFEALEAPLKQIRDYVHLLLQGELGGFAPEQEEVLSDVLDKLDKVTESLRQATGGDGGPASA